MKFELVSTSATFTSAEIREGKHKLEMLAIGSDMEHYASNKLGRPPSIGETFSLETSWPRNQENPIAATQDDYEKYGTLSASGIFRRTA